MINVLRKVCRNGQKNTLVQNHAGAGAGDARRADRHYSAVFEQNRARQRTPEYGPGIPHRRQAAGEGVAPAGGLLIL